MKDLRRVLKMKDSYTAWTCRPSRRLLLMIFRPLLVRIRARKPNLRTRLRFEIR